MRILVCAQDAPIGPINGFRRQVASVVGALDAWHDVRLVAVTWPDQPRRSACAKVRLVAATPPPWWSRSWSYPVPPSTAPIWCRALTDLLRAPVSEEIRSFAPDVLYVAGFRIAGLGRYFPGLPRVVAPLDAAHLSFDAAAAVAEGGSRLAISSVARWVRRFEAAAYAHFDRVLVLSQRDRDALLAIAPALRIEVIPHEVDAAAFAPSRDRARDDRRIIFGGVQSAAANVTAAEFLAQRIMPLVLEAVNDAHLAIVGRTPSPRVLDLRHVDGVRVVGEVSDMGAWLATSRACVAPMLTGSGVKNKLLEGMAAGLPCVATPRALGGVRATPGRELLAGEGAAEIAEHLVRVLTDDGLAVSLGAAARAYVLREHSRATVAAALQRICVDVVESSSQVSVNHVCSDRPPSTTISAPVT